MAVNLPLPHGDTTAQLEHTEHLQVIEVCRKLHDSFSLQDVVDRVYTDAPELVYDLPTLWGDLRALEYIRHVGLDGTLYSLSPALRQE